MLNMTNQNLLEIHGHCSGSTHFPALNPDKLYLQILTKQCHIKFCSSKHLSIKWKSFLQMTDLSWDRLPCTNLGSATKSFKESDIVRDSAQ
jgi:hypothetical protein